MVRGLEEALTRTPRPQALDAESLERIEQYVKNHWPPDAPDTSKLHEELTRLHQEYVIPAAGSLELAFVDALIHLAPILVNGTSLNDWFNCYAVCAIDSAGHKNTAARAGRAFLLSILTGGAADVRSLGLEEDKKQAAAAKDASRLYFRQISDSLLGRAKWLAGGQRATDMKEFERQRFIKQNSKDLLVQYGSKCPLDFYAGVNALLAEPATRLDVLTLLSDYVCLQSPHLYQIAGTPLYASLVQCLTWDRSYGCLAAAGTSFAMVLPHICNTVGKDLARLLALYGRLASWRPREFGDDASDNGDGSNAEDENRNDAKVKGTTTAGPGGWLVADYEDETQTPGVNGVETPLFTFLYGLFPKNMLAFLTQPDRYLEAHDYKRPFTDLWDRHFIQRQAKAAFANHVLHPDLLTLTETQEVEDATRWHLYGSAADIATFCLGLCVDVTSRAMEFCDEKFVEASGDVSQEPPTSLDALLDSGDDAKAALGPNGGQKEKGEKNVDQGDQNYEKDDKPKDATPPNVTQSPSAEDNTEPTIAFGEVDFGGGTKAERRGDTTKTQHSPRASASALKPPAVPGSPLMLSPLAQPVASVSQVHAHEAATPTSEMIAELLDDHERLYQMRKTGTSGSGSARGSVGNGMATSDAIPESLSLDDETSPMQPGRRSSVAPPLRTSRHRSISYRPSVPSVPSSPSAAGTASGTASGTATGTATAMTCTPAMRPVEEAGTGSIASTQSAPAVAAPETDPSTVQALHSYYSRELMLLRNELAFVSFLERNGQYRTRQLKERLDETLITNTRVDQLLSQNKSLKAKLAEPQTEADKLRGNLRLYRSERQAYEATLVSKNKDFRAQIAALKEELAAEKLLAEQYKSDRDTLQQTILKQEAEVSRLELQAAYLSDKQALIESHEARIRELESQVSAAESRRASDNPDGINGNSEDDTNDRSESLAIQLEQARAWAQGLERENAELVRRHAAEIADLTDTIKKYDERLDKKSFSRSTSITDEYKRSMEERFSELKAAHDDLARRYSDLSSRVVQARTSEEERRSHIDEPILAKRSLLGYELTPSQTREGSPETPPVGTSRLAASPRRPEPRVRGRGGIQNTSTAKDKDNRRQFRGIRM